VYCRRLLLADASFLVFDATLATGILFIRAYVVWPSVKFIPYFLGFIFAAATTVAVFFFVLYVRDADVLGLTFTSHGCVFWFPNGSVWVSLIAFIICDTVALTFIIAKLISNGRDSFSTQGILNVIAADGVGYYICSTAITVADVVIFRAANPIFRACLIMTQISLQNVLCNRLLLHIHAVNAAKGDYSRTMPLLKFPGHHSY